ncbi:acyl-coenzyme A thioesterase 13-like [Sycon ciliatum]|uniref:acyl-coenzyme A thioesterase 13-like n=1 Tax=Sycon ciliatum TaxID=27933 RepID=UPI0020ADB9AF|eukprot:scpid59189/ scgid11412/ Acyl-coenzyme A thioesterase 13; Thioesterase superfamily member 2 &gt; Acyl-coenzyme A thioesterase 13; Thioesterase superfamily member 2
MDATEQLQVAIKNNKDWQNFNRPWRTLKVLEVRKEPQGYVKAELVVQEEHTNSVQQLHGAMMCLLVDIAGLLTLTEGKETKVTPPVASIEMNTSCIRAVNIGETIVIEGRCLKDGANLGFTNVDIYRKHDGKLVASGRHTLMKFRL